jgi:hypothetical protein
MVNMVTYKNGGQRDAKTSHAELRKLINGS